MACVETLPFILKQLRMPAVACHWQTVEEKASEQHLGYGAFLAELMALEMTDREQKKLQRAMKASRLPSEKTLSRFRFSEAPSVNAAQVRQLSEDRLWVDKAYNLLLFGGPSGVGKTHIASAIGYGLLEKNVKVFFSSTTLMVQMLQQAKADYKLKTVIDRLARFDLVILDDIGYARKSEQETCVLFELIANRYETGSLLVTANQPFSDRDNLFSDKVMAVAAIDRLVHHSTIIKLEGESYRAREAIARVNKQSKKEIL